MKIAIFRLKNDSSRRIYCLSSYKNNSKKNCKNHTCKGEK